MKKLKLAAFAVLGLYACLNFSSCKKDNDDEPSSDKLPDVLVGTWGFDEEINDDVYVLFSGGSGELYSSRDMDIKKAKISWQYKDDVLYLSTEGIGSYSSSETGDYKYIPVSVTKNEITWDAYWYSSYNEEWEPDDYTQTWYRIK